MVFQFEIKPESIPRIQDVADFKNDLAPWRGDVDVHHHVNNLKYVEWMQRIAIRQSGA